MVLILEDSVNDDPGNRRVHTKEKLGVIVIHSIELLEGDGIPDSANGHQCRIRYYIGLVGGAVSMANRSKAERGALARAPLKFLKKSSSNGDRDIM